MALAEAWVMIPKLNKNTMECSIEMMPLVLCKECKHYKNGFCYNPSAYDDVITCGNTSPDWFCGDGIRRETDE